LNHLKQGGGAYHFCYAVSDLAQSIDVAIAKGAKLVSSAKPDDAFYGRAVAFLIHPYLGLFELLEAHPSYLNLSSQLYIRDSVQQVSKKVVDNNSQSIKLQVITVFNRVMKSRFSELDSISMQNYSDWDSVKHILLMMELESHFDIQIPSEAFSQLISIDDIYHFICKKLS
jgi:acyl carrier protein